MLPGLNTGSTGGALVKWTKDKCLETAKKYKRVIDFQKHDRIALDTARRNGWFKDYAWLQFVNGARTVVAEKDSERLEFSAMTECCRHFGLH